MKIRIKMDNHPNDRISESWGESGELGSRCSGYNEMIRIYPAMREWLKAHPPDLKNDTNQSVLDRYFEETSTPQNIEIEGIPCCALGSVLLAWAERLFVLIGEQAARQINTRNTEEQLLRLKAAVMLLSEHRSLTCAVIPEKNVENIASAKLDVLLSFPQNVKQFCDTEEYNGQPFGAVGLIPLTLGDTNPQKIYIIVPPQRRQVDLRLGWDGKNFVAVFPDALAALGLPASVAAQLTAPAAHTPSQQTPPADNNIEERVHGDVLEHKHSEYDYWHPASRPHKEEE